MSAKPVYLCSGGPGTGRKTQVEDFRTALAGCEKSSPTVAYIGTAHLDDAFLWTLLKPLFYEAGAGKADMVPIVRKPDPAAARRLLEKADAVFISGGEVEDGIVWLKKAGLDSLLAELYEDGRQFFGISAGCIMMGQHWVHWEKEDDDRTASLFDCLGFLPFVFDAHSEYEEWKELRCAVGLMGPGSVGYGLSNDGFYRADAMGNFEKYRTAPAVYENRNGVVQRRK